MAFQVVQIVSQFLCGGREWVLGCLQAVDSSSVQLHLLLDLCYGCSPQPLIACTQHNAGTSFSQDSAGFLANAAVASGNKSYLACSSGSSFNC